MPENEEGGITVPVHVGKKVDVTIPTKHSKKAVLFVNNKGHFHMVPEDMAKNHEKCHRGHIIGKEHKDYTKGFNMAVGYDPKIGTAKFVQSAGVVSSIEDAGRFDIGELVKKEAIESENAKKALK